MFHFTSKLLGLAVLVLSCAHKTHAHPPVIPQTTTSQQYYMQRYLLTDVYTKLVNNTGDGFEPLYGVRNFRAVLPGLVYRGGANNFYNKNLKRPNQNPLPDAGLANLCQEGFGKAVYLYSTNYNTAPPQLNCSSIRGGTSQIEYLQHSALRPAQAQQILNLVSEVIQGRTSGPIYLHCWNGWHASGLISALILRQFCSFTPTQALSYWERNTDGNNGSTYNSIREQIRNFTSDPDLEVSPSVQAQICPNP